MILDRMLGRHIENTVEDKGSATITLAVYADAFDTHRVYEEDPVRVFGAMTPAVRPSGGLIGKLWDERSEREHTIDARPYMALFDYARRKRLRVAEINLDRSDITFVREAA